MQILRKVLATILAIIAIMMPFFNIFIDRYFHFERGEGRMATLSIIGLMMFLSLASFRLYSKDKFNNIFKWKSTQG